ncbi:MAG: oligosaccharide flippase family protein [Lachnospiraceae bacterium]|nr:oligosaccharide flippase family protein [Lachnospiraceae bacterium]
MKEKSIGKNVIYSMVTQVFSLVAPLLTAPYVARIFNAELIGAYSFSLANSQYFVLLECLGLHLYGSILIAANRDDRKKTGKLFYEIMFLKTILLLVNLGAYGLFIIPNGTEMQRILSAIMIINIVGNGLDPTWLLSGLEEFKSIALRSISVRVVNVVTVFLFINDASDIYLYAVIMQVATMLSYLIIIPYARKKVIWPGIKNINLISHLKPAAIYFIPGLVHTVFSSTDKTMLGLLSDSYEVGIYEQANKISQICMNAISAIGVVLLPRATYLYHNSNDEKETNSMVYNSVQSVLFIALPITLGITAISSDFVPLYFGKGYEKSIIVLNILSFNVLFTSLSNICGNLCLVARNKQGKYNIAICLAALMNIVLNTFFISTLKSIGAGIASVIASVISISIIIYMSRDILNVVQLVLKSYKYLIASLLMYITIKGMMMMTEGNILDIIIYVLFGAIVYFALLFILKDEFIYKMIKRKKR